MSHVDRVVDEVGGRRHGGREHDVRKAGTGIRRPVRELMRRSAGRRSRRRSLTGGIARQQLRQRGMDVSRAGSLRLLFNHRAPLPGRGRRPHVAVRVDAVVVG